MTLASDETPTPKPPHYSQAFFFTNSRFFALFACLLRSDPSHCTVWNHDLIPTVYYPPSMDTLIDLIPALIT